MDSVCPSCKQPIDIETNGAESLDQTSALCPTCREAFGYDTDNADGEPTLDYTSTKTIAHFALKHMLGSGAFGAVWLAEDANLGRDVALKLPKTTHRDAKLLHEAKTAAKLNHPNIVSVYEVGVEGEQVYIASEYIDGLTLREELERKEIGQDRSVQLAIQILKALEHAHRQGVVHRDIKPANVILNQHGEPFITDFGMAKQVSTEATISSEGQIIGTISYMSPEQAKGNTRATDHRSDIYALGVLLFEMLTGGRPFQGNARAVIHQKLYEDPPSPRRLVPTLPKDLETICLKCLERDATKRYASASDVADELIRVEQGIPIKARPVGSLEKAWRWCKRRPAIAGLITGIILSLTLGLVITALFSWHAMQNAEQKRQALYRARMSLASRLDREGDVSGLQQTLSLYDDDSPDRDLRGAEWEYFRLRSKACLQIVNHGDYVVVTATSKDGKHFAAAGADRLIRVWEAATRKNIRVLRLPPTDVVDIDFSPKDNRLISAHSDGTLRLWNPVQHGRVIKDLYHGSDLRCCRFSPDGRFIASSASRQLRLWKVSNGEVVRDFNETATPVTHLAFDPSGRHLAVASEDGKVAVIEVATGTTLNTMDVGRTIESVAFSSDGNQVGVAAYSGEFSIWSVDDGSRVSSSLFFGGAIGDVQFLGEIDAWVITSSLRNLVVVSRDGKAQRSFAAFALSFGTLSQSADGRRICLGSGDGSVKLFDVAALQGKDILWKGSHIRALSFLPDGQSIVTAIGDGSVTHCNAETLVELELVSSSAGEVLTIETHTDTERFAIGGMARDVSIWDANDLTQVGTITQRTVACLAYSDNGKVLALGTRGGLVRIHEAQSPFAEIAEIQSDDSTRVNALEFLANSEELLVAYGDGRLAEFDARHGTLVSEYKLSNAPLSLVRSNDRNDFVVGTQNGELLFWNAESRAIRHTIKAHAGHVTALAMFPDGSRVVSVGRDRNVRIWHAVTGDMIASLTGHQRQIFDVAVAPDGTMIVSGGLEGDVRFWRTRAPEGGHLESIEDAQPAQDE